VSTVPKHDNVNGSFWLVWRISNWLLITVVFDINVRLTLGLSENEFLKSFDLTLFNHTGDMVDDDGLVSDQAFSIFTIILISVIALHLTLELWNHRLSSLENDKAILKALKGCLGISELYILLLHESLLLFDLLLNFFKQQIDGLPFVLLDLAELGHEALNIFRWRNFDKGLLALVEQVIQFPFSIFTSLNLRSVRKIIH